MAAVNAMLLCGTAVALMPEDRQGPEADGWAENLAALGIEVDGAGPARYLAWLRYYALETAEDLAATLAAVGRLTGVREEDVAGAVASFRRREGRRTDTGGAAEEGAEDGDSVQAGDGGNGA